jgi:two-component system, LytTR family, response regulator
VSDPIRALVVDDEPLSRRAVRLRLAGERDVVVVGESTSGPSALRALREEAPHLVFLDIQLPGMDGFEVLRRVAPAPLPDVVFVTAFDQHAVRAFEVNALDYLLKPFSEERFREAMERARSRIRRGSAGDLSRLKALLRTAGLPDRREPEPPLSRVRVRDRDRIYFVNVDDVVWIGAEGNYAALHTPEGTHLVRATLTELEERLDPSRFARIHRSTIVNLDRVREIRPFVAGSYTVVLEDGTRLRLSRGFRDALLHDAV